MTTALVTGATGFLGGHLVRQLCARGVRVKALVRRPMAATELVVAGAELVRGDVLEPATLKHALDQPVDWLFHCAANTSMWRGGNALQTRVNVEGTSNVLAAARGRVGRFMHTSTVAVYGFTEDAIREDSPKRGADSWVNYVRTKTAAEQLVLASAERGMDAVILNPTHMLGPHDRHNWSRLIQLIDNGALPGAPPGIGSFADVREVAKAHVRAAEVGRTGQNYLLGGVHASFVEFIATAAGLLGRKAPERALPAWLLRLVARYKVWRSKEEPDITPEAAAISCHRMRVETARAERDLDLVTPPLQQMLDDTIVWMRGAGLLKSR